MRIGLYLRAQLENIEEFKPDEEFRWYLKVRCANCGEVTDWVYVTSLERVPLKGGRGEAHFVSKCKLCARSNSIEILQGQSAAYTVNDNGRFKCVIVFECRGLEPVEFDPRAGFCASAEISGTSFSDISFSDKEWYDYDENGQQPVSITEVGYKFVKQ